MADNPQVIPFKVGDAFGSVEIEIEGFAYEYDPRYLRASVKVATRHFVGRYGADLEWPELIDFGKRCRDVLARKPEELAGAAISFDPSAERYVRLIGAVQKTGKIRWQVECRPSTVSTERFEIQITTELSALQPIATGLDLAARRWPQRAAKPGG